MPHDSATGSPAPVPTALRAGRRVLVWVLVVLGFLLLPLTAASAQPTPVPTAPPVPTTSPHRAPPAGRMPVMQSVFVPLVPCRIVDTRKAASGKIRPASTRTFVVRGTGGFPAQGGTNGGCGVPFGASGVTVNTTVTTVLGGGYLSGFPSDGVASTTNFTSFATGTTLTANPTFALGSAEPSLAIRSSSRADLQLIIDVTGYFMAQPQGLVDSDGTLFSGSTGLVAVSRRSVGTYAVAVDRDITYCTPDVSPFVLGFEAVAQVASDRVVNVYVYTRSGALTSVTDGPFYLTVTC